uniref:phospholipase D n=1 Tax=Timema bartmani TaxID=61472 RepID=A0A7R9I0U4_9NEOP|nr:unnamed protein product [Timema bartmani]
MGAQGNTIGQCERSVLRWFGHVERMSVDRVYGSQNLGNSQGEVGFYGNTGQRGTSGQESLGKFGGSQLGSRGNQAGSGYYGDLAGVKKGYNVANGYGGEQSYNKNGQAVQGVGAKGGHRKGHQTSGFTNSYHKDETGKTSNFFDDGLDEGTHYDYGKTGGEFRDGAGNAYRGGQEDGTYLSNQQGRQGNFDSAAGYNDEQGQKGLFGRGQFYNDQAKYGLDKGGKRYGENAYGGQQQRAGNFYDKAGGTFGENVAHDGYGGGQHFGGYEVPLTGYGYYDAKASNLQPVDYYPDGARSYGALYSRHGEKAPYVTAVPYNHYGDEAAYTSGDGVARKGIGLATFVEPITYVGDKESDISYVGRWVFWCKKEQLMTVEVSSGYNNPVLDLEAASSHSSQALDLKVASGHSNPALDLEAASSHHRPPPLLELDTSSYVLCIPFGNIHNPPQKFKDPQRRVFIPGTDIDVNIIEYDRSVTTHLLNPNLYTIELTHGGYTWTIKKRYSHIQTLHQQLKMYRTSLSIPFPTKAHREHRISFRHDTPAGTKKRHKAALPRFPNKPDSLVLYENIDHRIMQLESYLRNLLKIKMYRNHPETLNFLEVSHLSFVSGLGAKGKEGMVQKKSGSTQPGRAGCNLCGLWNNILCIRCSYICNDLCGKWHQRWFFIKDTFMGYITPKDGRVKCVMLFDLGFEVSSGMYATGLHHGLQLVNLTRHLQIKCWTRRKRKEWLAFIKDVATGSARDFTHRNRHNSFAPERLRTDAAWFVDGCSYMSAVADALDAAKEEIFIADWWLSPEIYLKRPITDEDSDFWRLDKVLARKAEAGVKVFVMLYKEVEIALGINSYYSKQRLVNSHPNIKVLRHPDHAKAGVFLWAHHEKIVVVDQTYAFLGGLDLCYGRWDDHEHRLTDIGSGSQTLGLFPPLRRKQTSSHPLAGSTPSVLRHLAVAGNTIGGSMLHTSQNNLAVVPVEEPTVFVPKHAHFKAQTSSNLIRSERDQAAADSFGNMAEHVKGNTPPPERRLIDRMTQRRTLDYWIGRTPHAEDSEDEDYIHIGSAIKSPTFKENLMEMVRELRERKTRWIPSFHKSPDNDEALPTSEGTTASPNPANLSNGTKEVSAVVDRSNNPPIIISSSETDLNSNKGIAQEKQEDWREGEERESKGAGDITGLPKGETHVPGFSAALPKYWIGKDYTNFIVKDFNNLDSPYQGIDCLQ